MAIQVVTFGGLRAADDTGELGRVFGQPSRAALFVYLAVERRASRDALIALFWPESDAENARHALRQSLYHLRKAVGDEWVDSRAHELVVRDEVRTDAFEFMRALDRGDGSTAVALYGGSFLDGVHLVDLKGWESWVDTRRAQYARAFRKACRELIEVRRAAGDLRGAIAASEKWARTEPLDEEAQHRLIETLATAGERADAVRQYDTYARALEADGLHPADETVALAERLRLDTAPLPTLRTVAAASESLPRHSERATVDEPDAAHEAVASRWGRWPRRITAGALIAIAVLLSVWGLRRRQAASAPPSLPSTIAVLPFSVRGGDDVRYLRDGMVNLLGAALDGAGSLRPVDARATFAAVAAAGGALSTPQEGKRVATRLGASMYVLGDVVEAGGQVQIEAAVYHVDAGCGPPNHPAAALAECAAPVPTTTAVVSGAAGSVFSLVDRLAARLLSELGDPAADRLMRTAALTTASLPAFKAYLQGEGLMRDGQFERAADAYLGAIALDSTFAVAHYRLALAREWAPLPGEEDAARAAARHGARLSARDRALLEAFQQWRSGDGVEAARTYRAILARYPDDVDAWFQLGEIQFHHGPLVGRPLEESEEAWRTVLSYEPRSLFALTHLARITVAGRRTAALDSLLAPFAPEERRTDRRLAELELLRAVAKADTAMALALTKDMRRWESATLWRVAVFLTAFSPDPALMRVVMKDLLEDYPSSGLRADLIWFTSVLDLAAGRFNAARAARADAVDAERTVPSPRRRHGFDAVTAWYAATLPLPYADSALRRMARDATLAVLDSADSRTMFENELGLGAPIQMEPLRQYTLGVLSLRVRDTVAAITAARKLERLAASRESNALVRDLDRGLRARLAWAAGRADDAVRTLEALESRDAQGDVAVIPFVSRASERFLMGELLVSLGRDAEALRWFASLGAGTVSELPLLAPAHLRQAEIHERLGHSADAARHYARFVELWGRADTSFELQSLVHAAHEKLARLTKAPSAAPRDRSGNGIRQD